MKRQKDKDKERTIVPLKPTVCPSCNQTIDGGAVAHGTTEPPKAGSVAVCMACGELLVFADNMDLTVMSEATKRELPFLLRLEMLSCQNVVRSHAKAQQRGPDEKGEQSLAE